jgi:hypothetical protein
VTWLAAAFLREKMGKGELKLGEKGKKRKGVIAM